MLIAEPLTIEHVAALRVQAAQAAGFDRMRDPDYLREIIAAGPAFGVRRTDGRQVALAGLSDGGGGRAVAWCFLAADAGSAMVSLVRGVRRYLAGCAFDRVELVTAADWDEAHRFAIALGFQFEANLRAWFPPIADAGRRPAYLWARVRHG